MQTTQSSYPAYIKKRLFVAARGTINGALNWGPIVGAAVLGLVLGGKQPVIFSDSYFGVVASGVVYAAIAWVAFFLFRFVFIAPFQMWREALNEIPSSLAHPERMPITELAALAEAEHGWAFKAPNTLMALDFADAIRHGVNDDLLELDGLLGCMDQPEDQKHRYLFDRIPKVHFKTFHLQIPGFFREPISNYDITTDNLNAHRERFRDIHVVNREMALTWLEKHADKWKGRWQQSEDARAARREAWEAEVGAQGYDFEGDINSEQGRRMVKRSEDLS